MGSLESIRKWCPLRARCGAGLTHPKARGGDRGHCLLFQIHFHQLSVFNDFIQDLMLDVLEIALKSYPAVGLSLSP